jgi:hypothetical protein
MFILNQTHEFINVQSLQHASFSFVTQLIMSLELRKSLSTHSCRTADATHTCLLCYWLVLMVFGQWVFAICTIIIRAPPACMHVYTYTYLPVLESKRWEKAVATTVVPSLPQWPWVKDQLTLLVHDNMKISEGNRDIEQKGSRWKLLSAIIIFFPNHISNPFPFPFPLFKLNFPLFRLWECWKRL